MTESITPILFVLSAAVFLGSFGAGMKHMAPLRWEAWWSIYSVVSLVLFPLGWAFAAIPEMLTVLQNTPADALFAGFLGGLLWTVGGVTFGLSVERVGMALTYGMVMGLCSAVGSLVPFFCSGAWVGGPVAVLVPSGVAVLLAGVALVAAAGVMRERSALRRGGATKGLLLAAFSGIASSSQAIGFDFTSPIADVAAEMGISTPQISLVRWVVVCSGAAVSTGLYCLVLLVRSESWKDYARDGVRNPILWAMASGLMWFASFGLSGLGMQMMGKLGVSVGWSMLLGFALVTSTLWSAAMGEWRGKGRAAGWMVAGVIVVIGAICLLGYANSLS